MAKNTSGTGITGQDKLNVRIVVEGSRVILWRQFLSTRLSLGEVAPLSSTKRPFKWVNVERSSAALEMSSRRETQLKWMFSTHCGMTEGVMNVRVQRRTEASSLKKTSLNKWYRLAASQEEEVRAHALKELTSPCRWSTTASVNSSGNEPGNGWMRVELESISGLW